MFTFLFPVRVRWTPRTSYLLALGLVGALSVVAFVLLSSMIRAQESNAQIINVSGRQRMLSQRTTLFALQLVSTPPGAARDALRESLRADLNTMMAAHSALLQDVRRSRRPGQALSPLQTLYFGLPTSLDALVQAHAQRTRTVLATPAPALTTALPALQALLVEGPGPLLEVLDAAVRIHQADAERRIQELRRGELAVLAATLLTLLLEGVLIFRPLERALRRRDLQLVHGAFHDALTGLPNRALFLERLQQAIVRQRRHPDARFAVLFLDCDRFKVINDSLGHEVGDALLIALAARLSTCVREEDTVARLGGDEFTLLIQHLSDPHDAVRVAERVARSLEQPLKAAEHTLPVSVSIGLIFSEDGYAAPADVLRDADLAMYQAKARGRGQYELFTPHLRDRAAALLNIELDLRGAQERGELAVHYQPVVALPTSEVTGFEALLRWTHPVHGAVSPAAFIPVAEDSGLIVALDRFVLRAACRQGRACQLAHPHHAGLTISVNVSGRHLQRPNLAAHVGAVLRETGLAAHCLKLELTEGVLATDSEDMQRTVEALRALGVQLHIDDFGTGYSNLAYLQRFNADAIKIDRSFIGALGPGGEGQELVASIVAMAHNLKLAVVAEGVETEAQRQLLRRLGCEAAQGYLFSRPLPAGAAGALLAQAASGAWAGEAGQWC